MSGRAVARGAIVSIAAALVFAAVAAQANDDAHRIAEKFAGEASGAEARKKVPERKAAEAKKPDAEPGDAARRVEAERKAEQARKQEAQKKAEAARRAAEAKRRAAAKATQDARRAAEQRRADESDMLARARREGDEMRAAAEEARLTEEARRLIGQAQKERAKAEELLAGEAAAPRRSPEPVQAIAEPERTQAAEDERLARQRTEETRRLAEKLNRVRQIRESRLAGQARREAEEQKATAAAAPPPALPVPLPPAESAPQVAAPASAVSAPTVPPPRAPDVVASPAPAEAVAPVAASTPPPLAPPQADPPPPKPEAVATAPPDPPPPSAQVSAAAPPADEPADRTPPEPKPHVAAVSAPSAAPAPADPEIKASAGLRESRVTVLLVMTPGTYGIRRNGPKVADPVLCMREGCYVSTGADRAAAFLPGRKALGFGNTWGARAGACRNALGCVFRGVDLGILPGYLQPVDLHILKHDRRVGHSVLTDSDCRAEAGRLFCRQGIDADNYTMWIVPESLAAAAGPAALQRALTDGLDGPRSAQLVPR